MSSALTAKRIIIAMSGGVDSSVAALLLKESGYDVVGVTLKMWVDPSFEEETGLAGKGCCSYEAVQDAKEVASLLDIPHYVLNMRALFYKNIVCNFTSEYLQGRTPNPCVECNRTIKFSSLFQKARGLGVNLLATGHYARIKYDPDNNYYKLLRGLDHQKDQSYMLYVLTQRELAAILFPLGSKTKSEIRALAEKANLQVANKEESQEICFIPDNNYRSFMERMCPEAVCPGEIVTTTGEKLGRHQGIAFYTVGQRKGLGITYCEPLYVVSIDASKNQVIVGPESEIFSFGLTVDNLNYIAGIEPDKVMEIEVKIRYRASAVQATLYPPEKGIARVIFKEKQKAITPGQSAVFYIGEEVLGGGIIKKPLA